MSRSLPTDLFRALLGLAFATVGVGAMAALPPRSPANLKDTATLIVTGKLISSKHTVEGKSPTRDNVYLLSVAVDGVEKGKGVAKGDTVEIRCWTVNSRPDGWAGPAGHFQIPEKNQRSRFWLIKREDGKWEPLEPNGIAPLDAK